MTSQATFARRLVFEHEWAALGSVTFETGFIVFQHRGAARENHRALVRFMTVRAGDLAFEDWMMSREIEFRPLVEVALEANFGRLAWVDDRVRGATGFFVNAAAAMASFASNLDGIVPIRLQSVMGGGIELRHFFLMTFPAIVHADERGAWNFWRDDRCSRRADASHKQGSRDAADQDQQSNGTG